jgi:hypothetical protein
LSGVMTGCGDYEELNTNPNAVTQVTADMLLTKMLIYSTKDYIGDGIYDRLLCKEFYRGEQSSTVDIYHYNNLGRTSDASLDIAALNNVTGMIGFAPDDLKDTYTGIGHFLRAYIFFDLTMRVGDIPYSQALQGLDNAFYPEYDTQKEVFLGLLKELDEADRLLSGAKNLYSPNGDFIYNGDAGKWRKATNVLQLRILINLYKKTGDADLNVAQRFQTVAGRPLFASNDDNYKLTYNNTQRYPFYHDNGEGGADMLTSVLVDELKARNDYRLFYYARPFAEATAEPDEWDAYNGIEPMLPREDIPALTTKSSIKNYRYVREMAGEPVPLLSYAEQNFILAEARVRGLISSGDARSYYEAGIRADMQYTAGVTPDNPLYHHDRKLTDDYIGTYLQGTGVVFASGAEEQIKQIITQKYISNFLRTPYNSYYEYRRTGYPDLRINPVTNQNPGDKSKLPARWMYSQREYDYNGDNVRSAVQRQFGGTENNDGVMWILQ